MPFCKHVVAKVILVLCSVNIKKKKKTGYSRSRGDDNKQCCHCGGECFACLLVIEFVFVSCLLLITFYSTCIRAMLWHNYRKRSFLSSIGIW